MQVTKNRQKQHLVISGTEQKNQYDKPWVLQFNYTDSSHISRCDFEKPGTWYPEIKGNFSTPEEALKKINRTLCISSEKFNDFSYGGRKWRLNNLETGDIIPLTITNEQATISPEFTVN